MAHCTDGQLLSGHAGMSPHTPACHRTRVMHCTDGHQRRSWNATCGHITAHTLRSMQVIECHACFKMEIVMPQPTARTVINTDHGMQRVLKVHSYSFMFVVCCATTIATCQRVTAHPPYVQRMSLNSVLTLCDVVCITQKTHIKYHKV